MPLERTDCENCDRSLLVNAGEQAVCPDCLNDHYLCCEHCNEYVHTDDARYSERIGYDYCETCYDSLHATCVACDSEYAREDLIGGSCESCLENAREDLIGGYCEDCREEDDEDTGPIRSYGYDRPSALFRKIGERGPWYGLELEVIVREEFSQLGAAETLLGELDPDGTQRWVAKEDASLDHGIEFESLPLTKQELQRDLATFYRHRDQLAGFYGHNAGLHVNTDRPASRLTLYKISQFMNAAGHADFLALVGQRRLNGYCYQEPPVKAGNLLRRYDCYPTKSSKHSIVAILKNRLEFRLFKANLTPERVNKAIDFCQAVIDFCGENSLQRLTVGAFKDFVVRNRHHYPDLYRFLRERRAITDSLVPERALAQERRQPPGQPARDLELVEA